MKNIIKLKKFYFIGFKMLNFTMACMEIIPMLKIVTDHRRIFRTGTNTFY